MQGLLRKHSPGRGRAVSERRLAVGPGEGVLARGRGLAGGPGQVEAGLVVDSLSLAVLRQSNVKIMVFSIINPSTKMFLNIKIQIISGVIKPCNSIFL